MTGLVGWWPLHENSGKARDLSGEGMHSVSQNKIVKGISGKGGLTCYGFNGSDSRVKLSDFRPAKFNSMERGTISIWFRAESKTNGSSAHFEDQLWGARRDEVAAGFGSSGEVRFNLYGPDNTHHNVGTNTVPSTNQWHHFAATFGSSDGMQVYLNGEFENSNSYTNPSRSKDTSTDNMHIGNVDPNWTNSGFDGNLCDFRIYNRVLTPQEIQTLYEWGSGDYTRKSLHDGSDSGAVSRWKFDGDVTDSWNSNGGTDSTSAGYTSNSIRGQAKSFDGADDSVDVSTIPELSSWTAALWFKSSGDVSNEQEMLGIGSNNGIEMQVNVGEAQFYIYDGSSYHKVTNTPISSGEWYHGVITWDGSEAVGYINGTKDSSVSQSTQAALQSSDTVGVASNNNNWQGDIDDVRIYNRALEPHEVFQLYQWGTRGRDMRKLTVNSRGDQ